MSVRQSMRPGPSPRRGFTMVGETHPAAVGPVVMRVEGSRTGASALRSAAEQAMMRSTELIVITPLLGADEAQFPGLDDREMSSIQATLRSPRVTVLLVDETPLDFDDVAGRCIERQASMLVLTRRQWEHLSMRDDPLERIMATNCDLLIIGSDVYSEGSHGALN